MPVDVGFWGSHSAPWLAALAAALILFSACQAALRTTRPRLARAFRSAGAAIVLLAFGIYAGDLVQRTLFSMPRVSELLFAVALALATCILLLFVGCCAAMAFKAIVRHRGRK
jgi:hypothetical protein